jgi:hypothetical protein
MDRDRKYCDAFRALLDGVGMETVREATQGTLCSEISCQSAAVAQNCSYFLVICLPSATIPARYMAS